MPKNAAKQVHGDDLLYRFFVELLEEQPHIAEQVLYHMYSTMGIWFPSTVYFRLPVVLPWVVRDPTCRGNKAKGIPDEWAAPDSRGFLRDDNSLVKALPRSLDVTAINHHLHNARLGNEFVAAHIWRMVHHTELASRHPLLNTFVANLVWLPRQIAKLTDIEGSLAQQVLQQFAWDRYRHLPVAEHLEDVVNQAWALIPPPQQSTQPPRATNEFVATDRWFATRERKLRSVYDALRMPPGVPLTSEVIASRYTAGLPHVGHQSREILRDFLRQFIPPVEPT